MVFLNPLASKFKVWTVFFSERDFLFKSILTWCEYVCTIVLKTLHTASKKTVIKLATLGKDFQLFKLQLLL